MATDVNQYQPGKQQREDSKSPTGIKRSPLEVKGRGADTDFTNRRKNNGCRSGEQIGKQYLPIFGTQILSGRDNPLEKWRPWFAESHDLRIFDG
ncbi:hypothetical protein [Paraburkholderia sp. GAS33]|uniref:hypothetical protein n=1 Tax=Paraburkholderia sp. GAS33 TaxID=3035130 RepID=UPI003D1BACC8